MNLPEYKAKMRVEFDEKFVKGHETPDSVHGPAEYDEWVEIDRAEAHFFLDTALDNLLVEVVKDLKQISHDLSEDSFDRIISQFEALTRFKGEEKV